MTAFDAALVARFGPDRVKRRVLLSDYTTFRVGGPAEWLVETEAPTKSSRPRAGRRGAVRVTLLGGGSNVLVSDAGVSGLVIRPRGGEVRQIDDRRLRGDAAMTINGLVRWTILHSVAGLEAWAGTPGTVGGAICGNAHFGGRLIGDLVEGVRVATRAGVVREVSASEMAFGDDRSRLQETGEVVLAADFRVTPGDPAQLRATARASLAYRKRTQPLETPSAGCVFQNPELHATTCQTASRGRLAPSSIGRA